MLKTFALAIRARLLTIVIFAVIIFGTIGLIAHGNAQRAETTRRLSTASTSAMDSLVTELVQQDHLQEALVDTQDPNTDANSPHNKQSLVIRTAAADSVNRLLASRRISDSDALRTFYELYKDADSGVKGKATDGLAVLAKKSDTYLKQIVDRLKDGDPDVRNASVDSLGKVGGDKTAKLINEMLNDTAARDSAEAALIKVGKPAIPYIALHVNEPDLLYREKIISMFGDIGDASGSSYVANAANGTQPAIRRVALVSISKIVKAVHDANANAKAAAAAPVVPGAAPAAPVVGPSPAEIAQAYSGLPILIGALNNKDDDADARAQAAVVIGLAGGKEGISPLVSALTDYDNHIQQAALAGLISAGDPAVPQLSALLTSKDSSQPAAILAAQALGAIATPAALSKVTEIMTSKSESVDVRAAAVAGLSRASNPNAGKVLLAAIQDPDGTVASAAADGLLNPAFEGPSVKPLIGIFADKGNAPFYASQVLAKMGDSVVPALITALNSANPSIQSWAAVTLGQTNTRNAGALEALNTLATNSNPKVQYAAVSAAKQLSNS